ncbi:MAG: RNA polymerase sigma factor, partial [Actinomycetota bacterium]|nr:RNA polymerase sigma factor [Actinomycetota bacterium]
MTALRPALPPFQVLLDSYKDDVHRFLVGLVGPTDADDCFQETFLAALRAYPSLRNGLNLKAWLLTIAHRKAIDRARRTRPAAPLADAAHRAHPAPAEPDAALWA